VRWLVLVFVVLPLADLFLLLKMGSLVGFPATVGLTVLTGMAGAWLVRREGRRVWTGWSQALKTMSRPEYGLVDGALVLLGAALLVAPGVLTDLVGLAFLMPWSRRWIAARVRSSIDRRIEARMVGMSVRSTGSTAPAKIVVTEAETIEGTSTATEHATKSRRPRAT
jgi:UPF0716 protein FxsA